MKLGWGQFAGFVAVVLNRLTDPVHRLDRVIRKKEKNLEKVEGLRWTIERGQLAAALRGELLQLREEREREIQRAR